MLELTLRLVVSLAVVVGLLLLLARFGARKFRGNSGALVSVVHRQALSRTSAVAVVTVGTRVLVLGTTEQQISVLAELDPDELELPDLDDLETLDGFDGLGGLEDFHSTAASTTTPAPLRLARELPRASGGSHRATPAAKTPAAKTSATRVATPDGSGPLAGSVLSVQTWRQAFQVATGRGSARRVS